ncbi:MULTISPECIES: hypothetical protein [unclassified Tolypothrix]|uniref:hypothetical protein n=1 Tax=unclassified Tolypothrix TaxID=2649714 RepID=UPI0005EAB9C5|nr:MULTISPECIES: hypothetical protein [unclassified Tolypothrix]BAY90912.1 hypothetical protein NIES3275_29320 [Microchaete diplosiphon NIES-3275]EKE99843.1 hypothetical protein FDUTEX481_09720 [Tolypothrix sp. PCC 7601]MBE9082777.1 hypothetical protein [Tolypothrix sp. LEGE 11397]UYD25030.1 hypothetical protein HGR01_27050 [Tolypothrix sp. PCC 7712]UYD32733.1 hypothetical protein HG267_27580 [Tolypothrix sp. PCC 7601]
MLSSLKPKVLVIRESKIVHKSAIVHPLARFVTEEAICLIFQISIEDIYTVECWRYMVYVHGKGLSKFVSYADFPPILGVKPSTQSDFIKWRRRWRKQHEPHHHKQAPQWWAKFFIDEFCQAHSEAMLNNWVELIELIQFAFNQEKLELLRNRYRQEKFLLSGEVLAD